MPTAFTSFDRQVVSLCRGNNSDRQRGFTHTHTQTHADGSFSLQRWRTVSSVSQLSVYVFFSHTHRSHTDRQRGSLVYRLCGFHPFSSSSCFNYTFQPGDAPLSTLIPSPFIHQTGKSDNFFFVCLCVVVKEWMAAEAGSLVSSVTAGSCWVLLSPQSLSDRPDHFYARRWCVHLALSALWGIIWHI